MRTGPFLRSITFRFITFRFISQHGYVALSYAKRSNIGHGGAGKNRILNFHVKSYPTRIIHFRFPLLPNPRFALPTGFEFFDNRRLHSPIFAKYASASLPEHRRFRNDAAVFWVLAISSKNAFDFDFLRTTHSFAMNFCRRLKFKKKNTIGRQPMQPSRKDD